VLLVFGIGIEILQGLPIIGRDADIFDVVADTCGIGFFFGPIVVRDWMASSIAR
jgi:glycopeptide antibiotics resistance protein